MIVDHDLTLKKFNYQQVNLNQNKSKKNRFPINI